MRWLAATAVRAPAWLLLCVTHVVRGLRHLYVFGRQCVRRLPAVRDVTAATCCRLPTPYIANQPTNRSTNQPINQVGAQSTGHYKLMFKPGWIGDEEASLVLSCAEAKCTFSFQLLGKGEEPLALDHVHLECMARDKIVHDFAVPRNTSNRTITYEVESDLPQISGDPEVTVDPNAEESYRLAITPQVGGTYSGTVTFRDAVTGHYFW